jgi:hypothetical protein
MMKINTSIYIPRMSIAHNEDTIRKIINKFHIGTISHIDFTPINKKQGFNEDDDNLVMSAFIHFADPFLCSDNLYHYYPTTCVKNDEFWNTIAANKQYKLYVNSYEYWLCLKNKNPLKRTMMNIHQVVENGRYLEKLIEDQSKQIEKLEKKIELLEAEITKNK